MVDDEFIGYLSNTNNSKLLPIFQPPNQSTMQKTLLLLPALLLVACGSEENNTTENSTPTGPLTYDAAGMDTSISPAHDFYAYCNGTWSANNPVPGTKSRWGNFNIVDERNKEILKNIMETAADANAEKGTNTQLLGDYYTAILDMDTRNNLGLEPIQRELDRIAGMTSKDEIASLCLMFSAMGIQNLFGPEIDQDLLDNTKYMFRLWQDGLGLPDRDYYFDEDLMDIRDAYEEHIATMLGMAGFENPKLAAAKVMDIETYLAGISMNSTDSYDDTKIYNKYTLNELIAHSPSFDWNGWFLDAGLGEIDTIVLANPGFFGKLSNVIDNNSLEDWQSYFTFRLISSTASMLTTEFEQEDFNFYSGVLWGVEEMDEDWKRAIEIVGDDLGEITGAEFVKVAFDESAKQKCKEMVENLRIIFKERIEALDWMSESTKESALMKLEKFTIKIGYPDKWTDHSSLDINPDAYVQNYFNISIFDWTSELAKIGSPVDWDEWHMDAHWVNAYYNPPMNEIVFPAGILQPPFFDPNAEDAVNYARIGAVIGHEFSHGFDDGGAAYNHEGRYVNWWTDADTTQFGERTRKLLVQFNEYEPLPGLFVNGELTLGENIADFAGLTVAYYAYMRSLDENGGGEVINGFTPQQRFFISFGQVWRNNYTDEALRNQTMTNPHSPSMYRVNGIVCNMPEFFEAFNVQEGDPMRQPADKIAVIW